MINYKGSCRAVALYDTERVLSIFGKYHNDSNKIYSTLCLTAA
jgi:hypothetical protein